MKRRFFLFAAIGLPFAAHSQPAAALAGLQILIKILGEAGQALADFSKGIKDATRNGLEVISLVSVERELKRIRKISKGLAIVIESRQVPIVSSIDEYLRLARKSPKPSESVMQEQWQGLEIKMRQVLAEVQALIQEVEAENGDLIFEGTYSNLTRSLQHRSQALRVFASIPVPVKSEELEALEIANDAYKQLLKNAREALNDLNKYAKSKSKS